MHYFTILLLYKDELPINVYIDLSKAFDTLDHSILIQKMRFCGFASNSVWLSLYMVPSGFAKAGLLMLYNVE